MNESQELPPPVLANPVINIRDRVDSGGGGGGASCSMHMPGEGTGTTALMVMRTGDCAGLAPRFWEINSFASATTILLTQNKDGTKTNASFWIELKTTRQMAALSDEEVVALNAYAKNDFIEYGIGVMVVDKHGTIARDQLGSIRVTTSAAAPA